MTDLEFIKKLKDKWLEDCKSLNREFSIEKYNEVGGVAFSDASRFKKLFDEKIEEYESLISIEKKVMEFEK